MTVFTTRWYDSHIYNNICKLIIVYRTNGVIIFIEGDEELRVACEMAVVAPGAAIPLEAMEPGATAAVATTAVATATVDTAAVATATKKVI
jgi:hypothetical protein